MENLMSFNDVVMPVIDGAKVWLVKFLPMFIKAVIIIVVGWWFAGFVSKLAVKAMQKSKINDSVTSFVGSGIKIALKIFVILAGLSAFEINVASLVAAIGAAGITAGLAMKDTLANVASGTLIIISNPFSIGDYIELEKVSGTVSKIDLMFTTLITPENKTVTVPNSTVSSGCITNCTKLGIRRLDLIFSVSYNDDIQQVRETIDNVIQKNNNIEKKEESLIVVEQNTPEYINIGVKVWCKNEVYLTTKYDLQENIKQVLGNKGITSPYSQLNIKIIE